jgi:hypothetical protein
VLAETANRVASLFFCAAGAARAVSATNIDRR